MSSEEDTVEELKLLKQFGGGTLCDLTVQGIRRIDMMNRLKHVSESTGVHIVCGAGFYEEKCLSDDERNMSIDDLKETIVSELVTGIAGTDGLRCGIIGEIGCSWPLTSTERKVLQAAALAQQQTGTASPLCDSVA